ncbi:MAG: prepilin-type N-terminal cleavage/methylation domain-containing protein [Candidatus Omnitrophota bacterium]
MRTTKPSAFTLLEIIIVIIIIGVLAGLGLPRLFKSIEESRLSEAAANISSLRSAAEPLKLFFDLARAQLRAKPLF